MPKLFLNGVNFGKGNEGATLSLFNQLAAYLQNIPGHKNLIWISDSFPLNLFVDPDSPITDQEIKETITSMTRAQVAVYPVDGRGIVLWDRTDPTGMGAGAAATQSSGAATGTGTPGISQSTGGGTHSVAGPVNGLSGTASDYRGEDMIAEDTGGRAFYSNNHLKEILDQAVETGSSFYTLTYSPPRHEEAGKQHTVEITLNRAGYRLSYRRFYYDVEPAEETRERMKEAKQGPPQPGTLEFYRAEAKLHDSLYETVAHGAPMQHDLIFSTHVRTDGKPKLATVQQMAQIQDEPAFFRTRRRNKPRPAAAPIPLQKFLIDYRVLDPELKRNAEQTGKEPTLEFAAAAYDADGRMVNGSLDTATAAAPKPGQKQAAFFMVEQEIDLPLSAMWLRVAVRDTLTDRTGAVEIKLPLQPEPAQEASAH